MSVRVELPGNLRTLAGIAGEVVLELPDPITANAIVDAMEAQYPMLRGTIREQGTRQRRAFLRFFTCEEDWSFHPMDEELPLAVRAGREPFLIIGAVAGGLS